MRRLLLATTCLLAGCGEARNDAPDAANAVDIAVPGPSDHRASPPAESAPDPVQAAAAIPEAFRGRWGMTPADCDPARDDNKGLMVVEPVSVRFYESRAIPRAIERIGPDEWRADLDYSGEGQRWSERTSFVLSDGGRTLTRTGDGPWTYRRCEAGR